MSSVANSLFRPAHISEDEWQRAQEKTNKKARETWAKPVNGVAEQERQRKIDEEARERERDEEAFAAEGLTELEEVPNLQDPGGLLGAVITDIYYSSLNPNAQVSLAAAITLLATLTQRSYNTVTLSGLNQYTVLLGTSGVGKEGAHRGMDRLFNAMRERDPDVDRFVGPSEIASPQALMRHLADRENGSNSFYTHKDEVGYWMQKLNDPRATFNDATLKGMLLALYHKSDRGQALQGSIYADSTKNIKTVIRPCLTLLGDTTPDEWFKAIDERSLKAGLVSRFNAMTCGDVRPTYFKMNPQRPVPTDLIDRLIDLAKRSLRLDDTTSPHIVQEDAGAAAFHEEYKQATLDKVWSNRTNVFGTIWSRAHIKVLRLGAMIAVGKDPNKPMITRADYEWARDMVVEPGIRLVERRFEQGDVGQQSVGHEQSKLVKKLLWDFYKSTYKPVWSNLYIVNEEMHRQNIISLRMLKHDCFSRAPFKNDKNKMQALENELRSLVEEGTLSKIVSETNSRNGAKAIGYRITNPVALK